MSALAKRLLHTSTTLEAKALVPELIMRLPISVRIGQVPLMANPASTLSSDTSAVVSMALGSQWGISTVYSGIVQGLGVEIVMLAFAWKRFTLPTAMLSGVGAGVAPAPAPNRDTPAKGLAAGPAPLAANWIPAKGFAAFGALKGFYVDCC